jgi:hypothetical protein
MARGIRYAVLALSLLICAVGACSSDDGDPDEAVVESQSGDDVLAQMPDLATQFVNAVFRIETEGCGWIGSGSGFAIDAHHVVTNHHVVANDSSPIVRTQDGRELHGRVIGSTERPDLAVISVDADLPTTVSWADTAALQRNESLVVMGFPIPDRTFKISTGSVIAFQPPDARDALIANNPIDRGNSGGPALRRDGTVAGVVTEMATRDDDGQRVAIVFTSNNVRATAQRFIEAPTDVLSSCGLGPDYVPEVPTDFDLPPLSEIPAPPQQPTSDTLGDVNAPTTRPTAPTVPITAPPPTVACPSAEGVAIDITEATAGRGSSENEVVATVSGTVTNSTSYTMQASEIRISFGSEAPGQYGYASIEPPVLAPGASRAWTVTTTVPSAYVVNAEARLQWTWVDQLVTRCTAPNKTDTAGFGTDAPVTPAAEG